MDIKLTALILLSAMAVVFVLHMQHQAIHELVRVLCSDARCK